MCTTMINESKKKILKERNKQKSEEKRKPTEEMIRTTLADLTRLLPPQMGSTSTLGNARRTPNNQQPTTNVNQR